MSRNAGIINKFMNNRRSMSNDNDNSSKYTSSEDTSSSSNILYVEPTLFGSGNINPFSSRLITSYLTINSLFRPNYNNTLSTDYMVELPDPIKKVAAYELASFSCLPIFYNVNASTGTNKMIIVIENPPNNIGGGYVTIEIESGVYQPSDINSFFNGLFSSSSNGLQFLRCVYNYLSKKVTFRAYNFWLDGYLTQIVNDVPVLGGGPFDEMIIDPNDPMALIPNPFYEPTCKFIFDFTTQDASLRPIYRNLGWLLGFTYCRYEISMDNSYTYYTDPYYNFYGYFDRLLPTGYTNDLYLQQYFGIDTSFLNIYGYIEAEHIFVDRSIIPNTGIYVFLDIDDYNKNYNPTATTSLSENFDSTFSATTFSKINISTTNITIDNNPNRVFYGPVDIRRLHVRLLNQYGEVINILSDFAFTLRITQIY
jgi:hypothetical protein